MRTPLRIAQLFGIAVLSSAGLTACANLNSFASGDLAVPPDSPVAVAARDAQRNPGPWPTFATIHKVEGKDAAPAPLALSQAPIQAQADRVRADAAANPPTPTTAIDAFVAQQQAIAGAVTAPADSATPEIEDFARAARVRATPPPPPS